jgi:hypothetical protein
MDMGAIGGALASINAARDIAKTMIGLRDAELLQAKTIELNGLILQALGEAIEARQAEAAQINHIGHLEAEIARLKAWGTEKDRYELKQIDGGFFAYMLKPAERGSEPPHWLCATCYSQSQKGFLQAQGRTKDDHHMLIKCGTCGATSAGHWNLRARWLD